VTHGREPGPTLFVSAAVHGDEIGGVAIIRRLLKLRAVRRLSGTLIAAPVVNVYGFQSQSRYLPDRRDLNRSFPGSPRGPLAARLAHRFMTEIVERSTHGIDLHTGPIHRANLPQIRACIDDPQTARLARVFGAPVILNADLRDGSLRQAVFERRIPMLLYEGGEALRFDEVAIRAGMRGTLSVMSAIGMLPDREARPSVEPFVARSSTWVRAPDGGVLRSLVQLGGKLEKKQRLGVIAGPLGENEVDVRSPVSGVLIGATRLPLVNEGDALFHVATFDRPDSVAQRVEALQEDVEPDVDRLD
jgi:predicted deacylase